MTRYQLAKLIEWAGTLRTRKKMQKVAFLLQAAGCPLGADFGLHPCGPYSPGLARLADEMVRQGLLREQPAGTPPGQEYHYALTDEARGRLREFESAPGSAAAVGVLAPFADPARRLLAAEAKDLEVAATLAFFRARGHDWPAAVASTCRLKSLRPEGVLLRSAEGLARDLLA